MKTRSKAWGIERRQLKFLVRSHRMTLIGLSGERTARFSRRTDSDWLLISIKTADWAPRLKASRPMAPVPANRSSTRALRTWDAIILKIASRVRSDVGLVLVPRTGRSFLPLNFPPIIRNTVSFTTGDLGLRRKKTLPPARRAYPPACKPTGWKRARRER